MTLPDIVMIVGVCVAVAACVVLAVKQLRSSKEEASVRRGARLDSYMAVVWSGFLLVQGSEIINHMRPDGRADLPLLSLAAAGSVAFVCGAFAGRLSLRQEMRLDDEKRRSAART
ncbi:MAG TPA: hypothetical protein VL286_06565 [Rhizomicrobium sp.]|nr:hypothetical protein [Rhizomicrobium sp.]